MKSSRARRIFLPVSLLGLFLLSSCAPSVKQYPKINQLLLTQDYASACKLVKESKKTYAKRNAALYYLDEGILLHYAARYKESNLNLSEAESIMDELYTKSLSKEVASFLISDNTIPYRGEDFERAMVNLFMALNYVGLGDWEGALVEARKVDNTLSVINSKYDVAKRNVYKEDGFIRYLMGTLYEAEGEINDAFISYRKAEEVYRSDYVPNYGVRPPAFLIEDLLAAADAMDFEQEMREIQNAYPHVTFADMAGKTGMAEVLFVHYNGLGPEKVENSLVVPMPDGFLVKIAYPIFVKRSYQISHGQITLSNMGSGKSCHFPTVLMEDVTSIAITNLENRINRIKAKAIARATTKYLLSKQAEKSAEERGGVMAGLLVKMTANIASAATEQADVRHWRLLPAEIRVGRAVIAPGTYRGKIDFVDARGAVMGSREIPPFSVKKKEKRFFMFRTLY
ncbi:MAG: hypothetical protein JRJ77_15280 [Deltaproteobacteria bacterium]|nr:hypothetical protein [Deltaproteobacteria bacterium]MBW2342025.1 hypothetical protein [Deltaproteobacteria bacterium]